MIRTDSAGRTFARRVTDITPVVTPHPSRQASAGSSSSVIGTVPASGTIAWRANDETNARWFTGAPSRRSRVVPSPRCPPSRPAAAAAHRFERPSRQKRQCPHGGENVSTTRSPTRAGSTPSPTSSITAQPSWPSTIGSGIGHVPSM